jgi:hypothetical protein
MSIFVCLAKHSITMVESGVITRETLTDELKQLFFDLYHSGLYFTLTSGTMFYITTR